MALIRTLEILASFSTPIIVAFALTASGLLFVIHKVLSDRLSHVPGPFIARLTPYWIDWHTFVGDECTVIDHLHKQYGSIVRIAPHQVAIADGAAIAPIMTAHGGFAKSENYAKFDFEGFQTIFSTRDASHRAPRAKAVLPLFSTSTIRDNAHKLEICADQLIKRLQEASRRKGHPVNVHNLSRTYSLDAACSYLLDTPYGALQETQEPMSASPWVSDIVAFGRFFNLPNRPFTLFLDLYFKYLCPRTTLNSIDKVGTYAKSTVTTSQSTHEAETYQGRLLHAADLSTEETIIQVQDVLFAATDSTGNNLAHLIHHLTQNPKIYKTLQKELASLSPAQKSDPTSPPPYLEATIRETLRVSRAVPTRRPRVVPAEGYTYTPSPSSSLPQPPSKTSYPLDPGTHVGIQELTLHHNPTLFPSPHVFDPGRWLSEPASPSSSSDQELQEWKEQLQLRKRDWIPFGSGPRQCIARNLAFAELVVAGRKLAESGVLDGAEVGQERIMVKEWFNSVVCGERVEVLWR